MLTFLTPKNVLAGNKTLIMTRSQTVSFADGENNINTFFNTNCDDVIHREMNWEKSHLHIQHKYINMNQRTEIDETRVIVMLKTVKQLKY